MQPLISIALCTYNGERFLSEQVESILHQTYPNIELVICDDTSADGTIEMLKKYTADARVKVHYHKTNMGLTANVQFALEHCSGEFIALADQDDIWKPEKLQTMFNAMADELLIFCDSELVDESGKGLNKKLSQLRNLHNSNNTLGYAFNNCVWGHTVLFKKVLLKNILPFPHNVPHDSWIGFVAAAENSIRYLDVSLNLYRQHGGTATQTIAQKHVSDLSLKQKDYLKRKDWLKALSAYPVNNYGKEYTTLYNLFVLKEKGSFVFALFNFLVKHRSSIFIFSRKKTLSQFIEIRKLARGIILNSK